MRSRLTDLACFFPHSDERMKRARKQSKPPTARVAATLEQRQLFVLIQLPHAQELLFPYTCILFLTKRESYFKHHVCLSCNYSATDMKQTWW